MELLMEEIGVLNTQVAKSTNGSFAITQKELAEQYGYSIGVIKRAESLTKLPPTRLWAEVRTGSNQYASHSNGTSSRKDRNPVVPLALRVKQKGQKNYCQWH